jgi:hypothetical protein
MGENGIIVSFEMGALSISSLFCTALSTACERIYQLFFRQKLLIPKRFFMGHRLITALKRRIHREMQRAFDRHVADEHSEKTAV